MNNRIISIQSEGRSAFDMALALLFDNAPGRHMSHFCEVTPNGTQRGPTVSVDPHQTAVEGCWAKTLVLFWHEPEKSWKFGEVKRRKLALHRAREFVWGWLKEQTARDEQLGNWFDGSLGEGFLAFNEEWGHVGNSPYAFAAIRPVCAWYGK